MWKHEFFIRGAQSRADRQRIALKRKYASNGTPTRSRYFLVGLIGVPGSSSRKPATRCWPVYRPLGIRIAAHIMRASLPIALALVASTPCWGATVEEVAERALPGVVHIVTYDVTGAGIAEGSGFFVSPRKIITNEHVVDGAYSAEVFTDQEYYDRVTILNADRHRDLAILSVDAEDEIPLQINPDAELRPGQRVIVIWPSPWT